MKSAESRALIPDKETEQKPMLKKDGSSLFDRLPEVLQRRTLSFLVNEDVEKCKGRNYFRFGPSSGTVFFECGPSFVASAAGKAIHNLAHRIKVNETLAFMQRNPNILQTLPFPIEIIDRRGQRITRTSIIGALDALGGEYDVTEAKAGDKHKPHGLIPTIFSWFDNAKDPKSRHIKSQLQRQLEEQSGQVHQEATAKRMAHYLEEIEVFIDSVIECSDISNDESVYDLALMSEDELQANMIEFKCEEEGFSYRVIGLDNTMKTATVAWDQLPPEFPREDKNVLDDKNKLFIPILKATSDAGHTQFSKMPFASLFYLDLVQNFINNAFKPDPNDDGRLGVAWDCWQFCLDYIALLEAKVGKLGGWFKRKTDLADTVVYMVIMGRSQLGHLEVFSKGPANVANGQLLERLDCTNGPPDRLNGIGASHWFGFYGNRWRVAAATGGVGGCAGARAARFFKTFVEQQLQQRATYTTSPAPSESEGLRNNVGMRRSPAATATGQ